MIRFKRGNQREKDRERAQARTGGKAKGKDDGLTPEQRRERFAFFPNLQRFNFLLFFALFCALFELGFPKDSFFAYFELDLILVFL